MIKIYEVMAIEKGYPLFFLEHIKRLYQSIHSYKAFTIDELLSTSISLIKPELDKACGKNISLIYSVEKEVFSVLIKESKRPDNSTYETGASVGILKSERQKPLIKRENLSQRRLSEEICKTNGYYDLLLENRHGQITEGSRSNFLCIDYMNNIITSPIGTALSGITRETVFDICREQNIPVIEREITLESLKSIKSLIITGTSPGILPIATCNNYTFSVKNSVLELLNREYNRRKQKDYYITREFFK